jgi:hypothetical protein
MKAFGSVFASRAAQEIQQESEAVRELYEEPKRSELYGLASDSEGAGRLQLATEESRTVNKKLTVYRKLPKCYKVGITTGGSCKCRGGMTSHGAHSVRCWSTPCFAATRSSERGG